MKKTVRKEDMFYGLKIVRSDYIAKACVVINPVKLTHLEAKLKGDGKEISDDL